MLYDTGGILFRQVADNLLGLFGILLNHELGPEHLRLIETDGDQTVPLLHMCFDLSQCINASIEAKQQVNYHMSDYVWIACDQHKSTVKEQVLPETEDCGN